jgi:hypothetical protein
MKTILVTQKQVLKFFILNMAATVIAFLTGRLLQISGFNAPFGVIIGGFIALAIILLNVQFAQRRPDQHFATLPTYIVCNRSEFMDYCN